MTDDANHTGPRGGAQAAAFRAAVGYGDLKYGQLAQEFGVSQTTLARWAAGKARPTMEQRIRLADLAGVPRAFLEDGFAAAASRTTNLTEEDVRDLVRLEVDLAMRRGASEPESGSPGTAGQAS